MNISTAKVEAPVVEMTIGGFEIGRDMGGLTFCVHTRQNKLKARNTISGLVYHAPHRRFAGSMSRNNKRYLIVDSRYARSSGTFG
jgi:hypothetical protein